MIEETFVNFEVAQLLKVKGFDELCSCRYFINGAKTEAHQYLHRNTDSDMRGRCTAPTQQRVLKWLREVHNIHISICLGADVDNPNHIFYNPQIATFIPHKSVTYLGEFGDEEFNTSEEACEAAIKYCLENLIEKKDD